MGGEIIILLQYGLSLDNNASGIVRGARGPMGRGDVTHYENPNPSITRKYICGTIKSCVFDALYNLRGRKFLPSGRGEKCVHDNSYPGSRGLFLDNSKCLMTSERGVNFQFPPWERYGCFLEWPKYWETFNNIIVVIEPLSRIVLFHTQNSYINENNSYKLYTAMCFEDTRKIKKANVVPGFPQIFSSIHKLLLPQRLACKLKNTLR